MRTCGTEPTLIESITGTILLRNLKPGIAAIKVIALDGGGRPVGEPLWAKKTNGTRRFAIGSITTPWYRIEPQSRALHGF